MFSTIGEAARAVVVGALGLVLLAGSSSIGARQGVPDRLSDEAFWDLVTAFSEPDGEFRSDNLVSNERAYQHVMPRLASLGPGGAYLGVAPDQNFSYLLALRPRIAFVIDIRRGNLLEHLMFKAIIERSTSRAAFLTALFARHLPEGLDAAAPIQDLLSALADAPLDEALGEAARADIDSHLVIGHGLPLSPADRQGLAEIHLAFTRFGPGLTYASSSGPGPRNMPSYAELQQMSDLAGRQWGYLATEEAFGALRDFQRRNLVVPVVGDFAGPRALGAIGDWLRERGSAVTAFYTSNVEQYLFREGRWRQFYANVAALPVAQDAVFVRSTPGSSRLDLILPLLADVRDGRIQTYADITGRSGAR